MSNEGIYSRFQPGVIIPPQKSDNDFWFLFSGNKLLTKPYKEKVLIPRSFDLDKLNLKIIRSQYLGKMDGCNCYSAELSSEVNNVEGMNFSELRPLLGILEDDMFLLAGRAFQIVLWDQTHQYCGRCGTQTETKFDERAKVCPKCGLFSYPRLSPAIIVAVMKGDKILLAHNNSFKGNMYSIIAGFVEPGETFEECVQREVFEEVGIKVKNIKYFGSQPWPFPNSLMVGFTAEHAEGEINVDGIELRDADWYSADNLPTVASKGSIARRLIDWFVENH